MLKYIKIYIKILRYVSILTDHHQGEGLYLVKSLNNLKLFKSLKP